MYSSCPICCVAFCVYEKLGITFNKSFAVANNQVFFNKVMHYCTARLVFRVIIRFNVLL